MIYAGDRVVLTEAIKGSGGFFTGPKVVVPVGMIGVVRRPAGVLRRAVVAFPDGFGFTDYEVPDYAMEKAEDRAPVRA